MPATVHRHRPPTALVRSALSGFGSLLHSLSAARTAAGEAERLLGLSDDALARRGLTRDRVVHHAFRTYLDQ